MVLLCLSTLPIAFLQTRVLFNSVYAAALDTSRAVGPINRARIVGKLQSLSRCVTAKMPRRFRNGNVTRRQRFLFYMESMDARPPRT